MEFWLNKKHILHKGIGIPEVAERLSLIDMKKVKEKEGNVKKYEKFFSLVHDEGYLKLLKREEVKEAEAFCNKGSWEAMASGGTLCLEAADFIMNSKKKSDIFVITRPPGHHAHKDWTHGFCFINNAALTALYLTRKTKKKVVILDFDLHHGDGTEEIINDFNSEKVLYISIYDLTIFPGTGMQEEGFRGRMYHLPILSETTDKEFEKVIEKIGEKLQEFGPDFLVVSAGFDMFHYENMSYLISLTKKSYEKLFWVCRNYKFVAVLEGGYYPRSIKEGLEAFGF